MRQPPIPFLPKGRSPSEVLMVERKHNVAEIEHKWRQRWEADKLYHAVADAAKPAYYALTMYPYPYWRSAYGPLVCDCSL